MESGSSFRLFIPDEIFPNGWHNIILSKCYKEASNSPDTSTQLGAVIAGRFGFIHEETFSHNSFCQGWEPIEADYERPRKYEITTHAERRAIYKAARKGIELEGCTLYSTWAACNNCAIAIVESGISRLIRHHPPHDDAVDRWLESVALGDELLKAGRVEILDIYGPILNAPPILRSGEIYDPSQ